MELFVFDRNKGNRLTVWIKMSSGSFKNVIYKTRNHLFNIYVLKGFSIK